MVVHTGAPAPWRQGLLGTRAAGRDRTMGSPVVSSRAGRARLRQRSSWSSGEWRVSSVTMSVSPDKGDWDENVLVRSTIRRRNDAPAGQPPPSREGESQGRWIAVMYRLGNCASKLVPRDSEVDQETKHGYGDDDEARVPAAYIIKLGVGQAANVAGIVCALHFASPVLTHQCGPFRTRSREALAGHSSGAVMPVTECLHLGRTSSAHLGRPQSSSASRLTASHAGFFILSQSGERPER